MLRRIALALLVLLAASPAQAAITLVASGKYTGGVTGGAGSAVNAASANLGVVTAVWFIGANDTLAVSDDSGNGNVWVRRAHQANSGISEDIWDCQPCTFTNGMHVTVTGFGGGNVYVSHGEAFYSGAATAAYGAAAAGGFVNGTSIQPGSLTAPGNGYLYVTMASQNGAGPSSVNSGFTIQQQTAGSAGVNVGFAYADLIQSTASALNPTWSGLASADNTADMAYWAPATAPPPAVTNHSLGLLGVGR